MNVNQNLFQIFLTSDGSAKLPPALEDCRAQFETCRGDNEYNFFCHERLIQFIRDDFGPELERAYVRLRPLAYRADLGRYLLLFKFGGWYFDVAMRPNRVIPKVNDLKYIVFRDAPEPNHHPWETVNGAIFFQSGSPVLEAAIRMIMENIAVGFYGSNPLDPTGPGLLGRALAEVGPLSDTINGEFIALTPRHSRKNFACVLPSGEVLAWGKATAGTPAGNGLESYGAKSVNSYADLYLKREIYI